MGLFLVSLLLELVTLTRVNLPVWERVIPVIPGLRNPSGVPKAENPARGEGSLEVGPFEAVKA